MCVCFWQRWHPRSELGEVDAALSAARAACTGEDYLRPRAQDGKVAPRVRDRVRPALLGF